MPNDQHYYSPGVHDWQCFTSKIWGLRASLSKSQGRAHISLNPFGKHCHCSGLLFSYAANLFDNAFQYFTHATHIATLFTHVFHSHIILVIPTHLTPFRIAHITSRTLFHLASRTSFHRLFLAANLINRLPEPRNKVTIWGHRVPE